MLGLVQKRIFESLQLWLEAFFFDRNFIFEKKIGMLKKFKSLTKTLRAIKIFFLTTVQKI